MLGTPMSMWDYYRTKAAEFYARARNESDVMTRRQYETLASQYSRLAEKADRDATVEQFTRHRHPKSGTKHH
jgi:hypothetical protein